MLEQGLNETVTDAVSDSVRVCRGSGAYRNTSARLHTDNTYKLLACVEVGRFESHEMLSAKVQALL